MHIYRRLIKYIDDSKQKLKEIALIKVKEFNRLMNATFNNDIITNWDVNKTNIKIAYLPPLKSNIGYYSMAKNTIYIKSLKRINSIYHELFHVASTVVEDNTIRSGFAVYKENGSCGTGLTEGYTEVLTERYFKEQSKDVRSYFLEMHYLKLLEQIIGQNKMEELYFKADLETLISILTQYDFLKNIMDFIVNLDYICKNEYNVINTDLLKHLNRLLLTWYIRKLKSDLDNKKIDKNTYLSLIEKFEIDINTYDDDTICSVDTLYNKVRKQTKK